MTSWQDEQPMSRRALRESERKHVQAVLSEEDQLDSEEQASDQQIWSRPLAPEPLNYVTQGRQLESISESNSRRAQSESPSSVGSEQPTYRLRDFRPESRGSSFTSTKPKMPVAWRPPTEGSGDLDYHTAVGTGQGGSALVSSTSDVPPNVGTGEPNESIDFVDLEDDDRVIDITMTRRELRALRNAAATRVDRRPDMSVDDPTEQHTADVRLAVEPVTLVSPAEPLPAGPEQPQAPFDLVQPELRDSAVARTAALPLQAPEPEPNAVLRDAMAEFDALYSERLASDVTQSDAASAAVAAQFAAPSVDDVVLPVPIVSEQVPAEVASAEAVPAEALLVEALPAEREVVASDAQLDVVGPPLASELVVGVLPVPPTFGEPELAQPELAQPEQAQPELAESPVDLPQLVEAPVEGVAPREVVTAPEVYTRPIGHWSTQAGIDDKDQTADRAMSRDLSAIDAITTNALVLPNFPTAEQLTGPVGSTGEILITGSIDLPRSVSVNGRHPSRYDRAEVDLFDQSDREDAAPDSAPVRAIRAVSTHTSSQGIIATRRPKGNNLPVILSITAGVMMVGVVVLVVAGMVFKIF